MSGIIGLNTSQHTGQIADQYFDRGHANAPAEVYISPINDIDYEEGRFLHSYIMGSGSVTPSVNSCKYIRVGRLCYIQGYCTVASVSGPGGSLQIGNFPFTSSSNVTAHEGYSSGVNVMNENFSSAIHCMNGMLIGPGSTLGHITERNSSGHYSTMGDKMKAGTILMFGGHYIINDG